MATTDGEANTQLLLTDEYCPKTFEDVMVAINSFGRFQILIVLFTIYIQVFISMTLVVNIFYEFSPDHTCKLPVEGWSELKWTLEQKRKFTAPKPMEWRYEMEYDNCSYWNLMEYKEIFANYTDDFEGAMGARPKVDKSRTEILMCYKWDYDRSRIRETVVTQFNLVCRNKWMVESGIETNSAGLLFGSFFSGFFSDRFGRKITLLISLAVMSIAGIGLSFVQNYGSFMMVRCISVAGCGGALWTNFCYTLEFLTGHPRDIVGGLFFIPYACAVSGMAGISYLTRDWRIFTGCSAGPAILAVLLWPIVPESPRWLLAKGRVEEARKVIERAAKVNRVNMPNVDLQAISDETTAFSKLFEVSDANRRCWYCCWPRILYAFVHHKHLWFRNMLVFMIMFINTIVFIGLASNVDSFAGDVFGFALTSTLVHITAYIMLTLLLMVGRKPAGYLSLFFCATYLFTTSIWIPAGITKTVYDIAGMLGVNICWSAICVHAAELFPTVVRSTMLSFSLAFARIGGTVPQYIITPHWLFQKETHFVVFGIFAVVGAVCTILLPETLGHPMPETTPEAANIKTFRGKGKPR